MRVEVLYESETFWLDQKRMADLFGVEIRTVSYHLKQIYKGFVLDDERLKLNKRFGKDYFDELLSAEVAKRLAEEHFEKFRVRQDREFESDFDAEVKRIESTRPRAKKKDPSWSSAGFSRRRCR